MVTPVLQAVCPYRLRGLGTAMGVMYVVFIGGFAGGILADFFTNQFSVRAAVLILGIPSSIIGGLLLMNGARHIRNDLSLVVEELLEEQAEQRKRAEEGARTPVLQCANIDFSYGTVQVLFDVNFEIHRGECVALLGTNGAGKSTILRVASGLEVPERGVVRLNGRNITYVAPESRNLPDQARGDERVADGTGEEDGLDLGQVGVHLGHRQLVLVVAGPAQSLDDRHRLDLAAEVDDEAVEARHPHVGDVRGGLAEHRDALVRGEQAVLAHVDADGDDDLVEEPGGTTDDVEVAVGHRVERPGADSATHGRPSFRLGLGALVPSRDQGAGVA